MQRKSVIEFVLKVLLLSLSLPIVVFINYTVDPLQFYRKMTIMKPILYDQERYQNPGLAKNYPYDTVIIGTSMTENISPKYIKQKMGLNCIKLPIAGSTIKEQNMILNVAVKTGKVKNAIWGLDFSSFKGTPGTVRDEDVAFPYFLYDDDLLNDYKYLVNCNTTEQLINILQANLTHKQLDINQMLENYRRWDINCTFSKKNAINGYKDIVKNITKEKRIGFEWNNLKKNIDNNFISMVKSHPEVKFYVFFTPSSILAHKYFNELSPDIFENELKSKKYIVKQCEALKNVKIYDFQSTKEIIFNLDYYTDQSHHNNKVNKIIIDSLAEGKNVVTNKNIDHNLMLLKSWVKNLKVGNNDIRLIDSTIH
ncbi:MAG: hypothetical protein ACM3KR_07455 [Deltaproteobacteria bacterium]